ncbi:hypothetical protein DFH28DRAFT_930380 [Melampsora americana]|nr:hypothetical protein DFH28DRAFT_930380 [Melampsora americana]
MTTIQPIWSLQAKFVPSNEVENFSGAASNQFVKTRFEEQLDTSVVPNTWFHESNDVYIGRSSGIHDSPLPLKTGTIPSNEGFIYASQYRPYRQQQLHKPKSPDGITYNQGLPSSTVSQSGPSTSGIGRIKKTTFDHILEYEALIPRIDTGHATPLMEWDNLASPSILHDTNDCDKLGWASTPSLKALQHSDYPFQDQVTRLSQKNIATLNSHIGTDMYTGSQASTLEAIDTTSVIYDHDKPTIEPRDSSNGKKRLLIEEADEDKFTGRSHSPYDDRKEIGIWQEMTHKRKKFDHPTSGQSQGGVINDLWTEPDAFSSFTQDLDSFAGISKLKNPTSAPDNSKQQSKEVSIPGEQNAIQVKEEGRQHRESIWKMLKEIGAFHVSNSPELSSKSPIWFKFLREDMIKAAGGDGGLERSVHMVIECAQRWITTSLFGLIIIHYKSNSTQSSLEELLGHGFQLMQVVFDQWRYMRFNAIKGQLGSLLFETNDYLDPLFLFRYFAKLKKVPAMSVKILDSMVERWNKNKKLSKLPEIDLKTLYDKLKTFYNKDMMFIHGGLYSRGGIGNLEFEEVNFQSGARKSPSASKSLDRGKIGECRLISKSAKFLSPVGIELCQKVHAFFIQLIKDLLKKYKTSNKLYSYSPQQIHLHDTVAQKSIKDSKSNMETIVKAVSIAEYRVTVGFFGMIRSIYEKRLTEDQIKILIESGWKFLQNEFSKWKLLNFQEGEDSIFSKESKLLSWNTRSEGLWSDPKKSFHRLCIQSKSPANTPISIDHLTTLLRSWFNEASDSSLKKSLGRRFDSEMLCTRSCLELLEYRQ